MTVSHAVAWLFPGQGSQFVGMGRALLGKYPPARDLLETASTMADANLVDIVNRGPEAELTRTDNLQPALTAISLGCCQMMEEAGYVPDYVAGHSLGEFAALYAAGVITTHDALQLVLARGRLMHAIASQLDGGMLAVQGVSSSILETIVHGMTVEHENFSVSVANYNTPQQTVLSGKKSDLEKARVAVEKRGARTKQLSVSGPWHNPLLEPAVKAFSEHLRAVDFRDATTPIVTNVGAEALSDGSTIKHVMEQQLCSPVRWFQVLQTLKTLGVSQFAEVGPGKVLKGLLRGVPEVAQCQAVSVDGPNALGFMRRTLELKSA